MTMKNCSSALIDLIVYLKDPGTALMETMPIQVYTNENRL